MRMGGFWVVLRWLVLLFIVKCLICSVYSEAFLQNCRAEECSITRSILIYSSPYIHVHNH
jgi:hypothetical protein